MAAPSGLSWGKLHEAVRRLGEGPFRLEAGSAALRDLANIVQAFHRPVWVQGRVAEIIGIPIVYKEGERVGQSRLVSLVAVDGRRVEIECDDPAA